MKMADGHFTALKVLIEPLDTDDRREKYRKGKFPNADGVGDLEMRYRWDLFWAVDGYGAIRNVAAYTPEYEDSHIDTALRRIVPSL